MTDLTLLLLTVAVLGDLLDEASLIGLLREFEPQEVYNLAAMSFMYDPQIFYSRTIADPVAASATACVPLLSRRTSRAASVAHQVGRCTSEPSVSRNAS